MSSQSGYHKAAGYIYGYDVNTDTQALLFGSSESPSELLYSVTISEGPLPSRHFGLRMRADFSPLMGIGLSQIGESQLSLQVQANTQHFSVSFEPDPSHPGNALFRTSNGLHGTVIKTQSSEWGKVAVVGIVAALALGAIAITEGVSASVQVTVDTPLGSGEVEVEVGGGERPPEGGEGGQEGGGGS